MPTQGDPDQPFAHPSEFGQRHRFLLTGTYQNRWSDLLRTTFGLVWEVAEGNAFRRSSSNRPWTTEGERPGARWRSPC